jgi:hypothetical protein
MREADTYRCYKCAYVNVSTFSYPCYNCEPGVEHGSKWKEDTFKMDRVMMTVTEAIELVNKIDFTCGDRAYETVQEVLDILESKRRG